MNKNSPKSLRDNIKIMNSNLDEISIVEVSGNSYVANPIIESFMKENDIDNKDTLLESLATFYNIKSLSVLDENSNDEELKSVYEVMLLLENLNPHEVMKAAKGRSLLKQFIDQFGALIRGKEYNEEAELKKYIEKCDSVLSDIREEKKLAKNKSKDSSQIKFSAMYIFNIAKSLVMIFLVPSILSNEKIKWPAAIGKLFRKNATKAGTAAVISKSAKARKIASYALTGLDVATALPPDIEGLYLSFADYNKLLTEYETQIKRTRQDLDNKLRNIERSKEMNTRMIKLTEDSISTDAVEVHYQTPEELMMKDHTPEIVHDDENQHTEMEIPVDTKVEDVPEEEPIPHDPEEIPSDPCEQPVDFTPIDAIHQARCNPNNVSIAKYGDKYYIDHKDLQCYMDACGEKKYENALNSIIAAHDDPNLCAESVRVVMGKTDMSNLDSDTKLAIESSSVRFEVY